MKSVWRYEFPIGSVWIAAEDEAITHLVFTESDPRLAMCVATKTPLIEEAARQLHEYFSGARHTFELALSIQGTDFQESVWAALQTIPYGETRTYKQIATQIGNPKASRAVGLANNRNPISIIIPCHRVVGQNGALTGYAGGLTAKKYLLKLEANHV